MPYSDNYTPKFNEMFEITKGYAARHPNGQLDVLTFIGEYASSHRWVHGEYQGSDGSAAWEDFLLFKGDEQHWHYSVKPYILSDKADRFPWRPPPDPRPVPLHTSKPISNHRPRDTRSRSPRAKSRCETRRDRSPRYQNPNLIPTNGSRNYQGPPRGSRNRNPRADNRHERHEDRSQRRQSNTSRLESRELAVWRPREPQNGNTRGHRSTHQRQSIRQDTR